MKKEKEEGRVAREEFTDRDSDDSEECQGIGKGISGC